MPNSAPPDAKQVVERATELGYVWIGPRSKKWRLSQSCYEPGAAVVRIDCEHICTRVGRNRIAAALASGARFPELELEEK
jgi:hypothetical protein